ncbi:hypothetical protein [Aerosakkonema funiforme]|uniref:hypothetical protein n=1 Tax=Aerosakkonema funiforme TaxID=1246630 RepID=UPI001685B597|nr:hypothetical protein [Aerosakkonema funiforme]
MVKLSDRFVIKCGFMQSSCAIAKVNRQEITPDPSLRSGVERESGAGVNGDVLHLNLSLPNRMFN